MRLSRRFRKNCLKILLTLFTLLFLWFTINAAAIWRYGERDEAGAVQADAAVVLGAAVWDDTPSPVFEERIRHGVKLYQQGTVKTLIFTGGRSPEDSCSEAAAAQNYAAAQGVPTKDILIEERSSITWENLLNAKEIIQENGFSAVIIVSDPLHMKRAMAMAEDLGLKALSSPTSTSRYQSFWTKLPFLLRETFYYCLYQIYRLFI